MTAIMMVVSVDKPPDVVDGAGVGDGLPVISGYGVQQQPNASGGSIVTIFEKTYSYYIPSLQIKAKNR